MADKMGVIGAKRQAPDPKPLTKHHDHPHCGTVRSAFHRLPSQAR